MGLKEIGEFGFIDTIRRGCLVRPEGVTKAIGDDAAAFKATDGLLILVTTDLLVERVHFLRDATCGFNLGYKSLAVNLSDIAAMGGVAREAFVSIAIPANCELSFLEDLYAGLKSLAAEFDVNILGGDTTSSKTDLVINIVVTGEADPKHLLRRDAAKAGDTIFSTGYLGDSKAGLHLILNGIKTDRKYLKDLKKAHILPKPYLEEGRFLAAQKGIHAAIDISDGLTSDIGHIAGQSGVGVRLFAEQIPVSDPLKRFCKEHGFDPIEYALSGGEDYTLTITVASQNASPVAAAYKDRFGRPLYPIGEIIPPGVMEIIKKDGQTIPLESSGWDHFK